MDAFRCADYEDLASADVDGVLAAAERSAVEAHLATCSQCRQMRREQTVVRSLVRGRLGQKPLPDALRQRIEVALSEQAARSARVIPLWARGQRRRLILAGGIAAGLLLLLFPLLRSPRSDVLAILASDAHAAQAGHLALEMRSDDVETVRRFYAGSGRIDFERPADDLRALGFSLVGASVAEIGGVSTTRTLYRDDSATMVCRRFPSGSIALPKDGERVGDSEVFSFEGVTVAVTRLGDVTCCLATTMPRDEFTRRLATMAHTH